MRLAAAALLVLTLPGCGGSGERAVDRAARAFSDALEAGDGRAACARLAPLTRTELERSERTPCEQALVAQELVPLGGVVRVERYGRQASVRTAGPSSDTWYLSRFGDRWLVVAAGCTARPGLPAACDVEGA